MTDKKEYSLSFTGKEIDDNLEKVSNAVLFDEQSLTQEQQEQIKKNIDIYGDPNVHSRFFSITKNGVLSLVPEYRGESTFSNYLDSLSNNGAGVAGDLNAELPKHLVIPELVNGIPVNKLADGIFAFNKAIESVTFPGTISEVPSLAFAGCFNLKAVYNTDYISSLGAGCFQATKCKKFIFPNLKVAGVTTFSSSGELIYADVGDIETVPSNMFFDCKNLHTVTSKGNIESIENRAFFYATSLTNADFIKDVKSIGALAFNACDFEYDWTELEKANGCEFKSYATPRELSTENYWEDTTYKPCENPTPTHLAQSNPEWSSTRIGPHSKVYGSGCALFTTMHMYCGVMGITYEHPEEFTEFALQYCEEFQQSYSGSAVRCNAILKSLPGYGTHYTVSYYTECNTERLQELYDALYAGGYAYLVVSGGSINADGVASSGGHAVTACGITEDGEIIIADSSGDVYTSRATATPKYAIKYKNICNQTGDITIIKPILNATA